MLQLVPIAVGHSPQVMASCNNCEVTMEGDMHEVLQQYASVFEDIKELPPVREQFDQEYP